MVGGKRRRLHLKSNLHFLLLSFLFNFPPEKSISIFRELHQSNPGVDNMEKPSLISGYIWFFFSWIDCFRQWISHNGFDLVLFLFLPEDQSSIVKWGNSHLSSTYLMLTLVTTLHILSHLIGTTILSGRWWCPNFTTQLRTLRLSKVRELTEERPAWGAIHRESAWLESSDRPLHGSPNSQGPSREAVTSFYTFFAGFLELVFSPLHSLWQRSSLCTWHCTFIQEFINKWAALEMYMTSSKGPMGALPTSLNSVAQRHLIPPHCYLRDSRRADKLSPHLQVLPRLVGMVTLEIWPLGWHQPNFLPPLSFLRETEALLFSIWSHYPFRGAMAYHCFSFAFWAKTPGVVNKKHG